MRKPAILNPAYNCLWLLALLLCAVSCKKNIPDNRDSLGDEVSYSVREITPTLGVKTVYENITTVGSNTSQPLNFSLVNVRQYNGESATVLTERFPVKVWKQEYTGLETSLQEIEDKRSVEYRPMLEIGKNNGNLTFWESGNSNIVKTLPDSGYLFDVQIENLGGRRFVRDMRLKPYKEMPYSPSNYDPVTGVATNSFVYPSRMINLYGEQRLVTNVRVYFNKDEKNVEPGSSLTFSFLDSLNNPIDPMLFNETNWDFLVHGFDRELKDNKMVYKVAYPMPLITKPTRYTTTDGQRASVDFKYSRIGYGGFRQESTLGLNFGIFEEGHWEIQIRFAGATPMFADQN